VNPRVPPAVDFFDTNGAAGFIAGAVVMPHPVPNSNTTAIDFYIGREACATVAFLGTVYLNDTGPDTCAVPFRDEATIGCFVTEGARPHRTTTVLAFARNDDGVQPICSESRLSDRAVPVRAPRNVTFSDTDPALRSIGGPIRIEPADVEVNITGYVVYFSVGISKLEGLPAVFSTTKEDIGSEESVVHQGTIVPFAATHLIAFSTNADGESLAFAMNSLVDEVGGIVIQSAVNLVDSDGMLTPGDVFGVGVEIEEILSNLLGVSSGDVDLIDAGLIEQRRLQGDLVPTSIRLTFTVRVIGGEAEARIRSFLNRLEVIDPPDNATEQTPRERLEEEITLLLRERGITRNDQNLTIYGGDVTVVSDTVVSNINPPDFGEHSVLGASMASTSLFWLFAAALSFVATVISAIVCVGGSVIHASREQHPLDKESDMWRADAKGELRQPDAEPDTSVAFRRVRLSGHAGRDDDVWVAEEEGIPLQPGDKHKVWIALEEAMMEAEPTDDIWCPDSEWLPGLLNDIDGDETWRPEPDSMPDPTLRSVSKEVTILPVSRSGVQFQKKSEPAPIAPTSIGRVEFHSSRGTPSPRRYSEPDFFMGGPEGSRALPPLSADPWHAEDDEAIPDINQGLKWQALPDESLDELRSTGKVGPFFSDADVDDRLPSPALFTHIVTVPASQGPGGILRGGRTHPTAQMLTDACACQDPCIAQPHCIENRSARWRLLNSGATDAASSQDEEDDPFAEVPVADEQQYIVLEL